MKFILSDSALSKSVISNSLRPPRKTTRPLPEPTHRARRRTYLYPMGRAKYEFASRSGDAQRGYSGFPAACSSLPSLPPPIASCILPPHNAHSILFSPLFLPSFPLFPSFSLLRLRRRIMEKEILLAGPMAGRTAHARLLACCPNLLLGEERVNA